MYLCCHLAIRKHSPRLFPLRAVVPSNSSYTIPQLINNNLKAVLLNSNIKTTLQTVLYLSSRNNRAFHL
jgi:hypothetical protein